MPTSPMPMSEISHEAAVRERYSEGAEACASELCCPVSYDPSHLAVLPAEIVERDYGCGDPTPYVRAGDTVLDLGCGAGKVCWIAAQIAGPGGRVIGVDMNRDMLALAAKHHRAIADKVGHDTVRYHRAMIQDLRLDLGKLEESLAHSPVADADGWLRLREHAAELRANQPMIADESVDVVLSNCVLNLVRPQDKAQLFAEMYRVVRSGGRVAISDIVADEDIPASIQQDAELWSGCISGAYREDLFLRAFEQAGFHGVEIVAREREPWRTVEGIEFRSITVQAFKGLEGPCLERNQAVIYLGPFREVADDDGHVYRRGERMAVCDKTFHLLQRPPYAGLFTPVAPRLAIPLADAGPFDRGGEPRRPARVTKGEGYAATTGGSCGPATGCC